MPITRAASFFLRTSSGMPCAIVSRIAENSPSSSRQTSPFTASASAQEGRLIHCCQLSGAPGEPV